MLLFIEILHVIAIALITNSHLDGVYPIDISFGGALGVALFFLVSGFLLNNDKIHSQAFVSWWLPKTIRVFVPLYIVNIINALLGYRSLSISLLFPVDNNFWYVPAIVILYALYYLTYKFFGKSVNICGLVCIVVYVTLYIIRLPATEFFVEPTYIFRYLYGYFAMILGAELRYSNKEKSKWMGYLIISVLFVGAFLVTKIMINRNYYMMQLQFITQVVSVGFAFFITKGLYSIQNEIDKIKINFPVLAKSIQFIGKRTLEIYLVQFAIISLFKRFLFPINLLLIIGVTIILAHCVNYVSNIIVSKMQTLLKIRGVI